MNLFPDWTHLITPQQHVLLLVLGLVPYRQKLNDTMLAYMVSIWPHVVPWQGGAQRQ